MINRPLSRQMMAEVGDVLRPILERWRPFTQGCTRWNEYDEGLIAATEMVNILFEEMNPPNRHCMDEANYPTN